MVIYLGLIGFLIFLDPFCNTLFQEPERRKRIYLKLALTAVFLILALKKTTVGSDIAGYQRIYKLASKTSWDNFSFVYFEDGYLMLIRLFSKLGVPFQVFLALVYLAACIVLYHFIRDYSPDPALSMLIFTCYQFFVFYISGIRQMLSITICIFAFLLYFPKSRRRPHKLLLSLLLVFAATYIHRSAFIFLLIYLIPLNRLKGASRFYGYLPLILASIVFRAQIQRLVMTLFSRIIHETFSGFSGNLFFLCIVAGFTVFTVYFAYNDSRKRTVPQRASASLRSGAATEEGNAFLLIFADISVLLVALYIAFLNTVLLRATMYFSIFLIPGIPAVIRRYDPTSRTVITYALAAVLITLFVFATLLPNQFNLLPYRLFWQ